MTNTLTINLSKPVTSINILDNSSMSHGSNTSQNKMHEAGTNLTSCNEATSMLDNQQQMSIQNFGKQKAEIAQLCQTLKNIVNKLNQFHNKTLTNHKEEIAKLSVEIARKILMQKVQNGDYKIESIIQEVLQNAPTHQDIVIHLNPEDLTQLQNLLSSDTTGSLQDIQNTKFIADPGIGRAECLLKTPKGIVKSFIDDHIEQISEALEKME